MVFFWVMTTNRLDSLVNRWLVKVLEFNLPPDEESTIYFNLILISYLITNEELCALNPIHHEQLIFYLISGYFTIIISYSFIDVPPIGKSNMEEEE